MAIVVCHLRFVIPAFNTPTILSLEVSSAACGLSLFFLLSGYSLMLKERDFNTFDDIKGFYKNRVTRIFPLYWTAIIVAFIFQPSWYPGYADFSSLQHVLTIAGLQILFTPNLFPNPVLWFVSAIFLLYLLFPIIIIIAKKLNITFVRSILLSGLIVFIIFVFLTFIMSIDYRFFAYYWFFVVGIVLGKKVDLAHINKITLLPFVIFALVGLVLLYVIQRGTLPFVNTMIQPLPDSMGDIFFQYFVGTVGISVAVWFTNSFKNMFSEPILHFLTRIALSTFSIYLFHLYFLLIASMFANLISPILVPYSVILIGIPLAILIPPYIENFINTLVLIITGKWHTITEKWLTNG